MAGNTLKVVKTLKGYRSKFYLKFLKFSFQGSHLSPYRVSGSLENSYFFVTSFHISLLLYLRIPYSFQGQHFPLLRELLVRMIKLQDGSLCRNLPLRCPFIRKNAQWQVPGDIAVVFVLIFPEILTAITLRSPSCYIRSGTR